MLQPPESPNPVDRRASRKWVAGVLIIYGVLIVVTVRVAIGSQMSANSARQPFALAGLPASEATLSTRFGNASYSRTSPTRHPRQN
jgi:hypothetical protein